MNSKKIIALIMALVMLLGMAGCSDSEEIQESGAPAGVAVQVQTAEKRDISSENRVSGRIAAGDERSVYISTTAKCTKVYVEAGDMVNEGDIICTLDLGSTLANYNAAKASYEMSSQGLADQSAVFSQQIALLQKNVSDLQALYDIGAASRMEIDNARLQLQSAIATRNSTLLQLEAGMENAKASLEQLDDLLENVDSEGNIVAPITGTLASLSAQENSFVTSSYPVAVITGANDMKVTVSVSESLVTKLSIGDETTVTVSSLGKEFTGKIRAVEQAANMQTKLYNVTVSVPDGIAGLLSGMFADVIFHTETAENTVVIPTQAILTSAGEQFVFVIEGGTAKKVIVETGLAGSGVTQITAGLMGGEQLVTVGQTYLTDGDAVRIVSGEG